MIFLSSEGHQGSQAADPTIRVPCERLVYPNREKFLRPIGVSFARIGRSLKTEEKVACNPCVSGVGRDCHVPVLQKGRVGHRFRRIAEQKTVSRGRLQGYRKTGAFQDGPRLFSRTKQVMIGSDFTIINANGFDSRTACFPVE
jgi:hypothetical protein